MTQAQASKSQRLNVAHFSGSGVKHYVANKLKYLYVRHLSLYVCPTKRIGRSNNVQTYAIKSTGAGTFQVYLDQYMHELSSNRSIYNARQGNKHMQGQVG